MKLFEETKDHYVSLKGNDRVHIKNYPDGQQKYQHSYNLTGNLHGNQRGFYEDGNPAYDLNYDDGLIHGYQVIYCSSTCFACPHQPQASYYIWDTQCNSKEEYNRVVAMIQDTYVKTKKKNTQGSYSDPDLAGRFVFVLLDHKLEDQALALVKHLSAGELLCNRITNGMNITLVGHSISQDCFQVFKKIIDTGKHNEQIVHYSAALAVELEKFEYADYIFDKNPEACRLTYWYPLFQAEKCTDACLKYLASRGFDCLCYAKDFIDYIRLQGFGFKPNFKQYAFLEKICKFHLEEVKIICNQASVEDKKLLVAHITQILDMGSVHIDDKGGPVCPEYEKRRKHMENIRTYVSSC